MALLLSLSILAACSSSQGGSSQQTPASGTTEVVNVRVNVDGLGYVGVSQDGTQPEIGDPPFQSHFLNVEPGTELILTCEADADGGYKFVRWTKDGADFSTEQTITVTADADTEYIAVFMMDSGYDGEPVSDIGDVKTLGDVLGLPTMGSGFGNTKYVYAFDLNGTAYQAIADLDETTSQALWDLDFDDEAYDRKLNALIAPLPVTKIVNLTEGIPAQSELDVYVGKTFGDLFDEGWFTTGWNFEDNVAYMNYRYYELEAGFEGGVDPASFDEDTLAGMTVKSLTYGGIGDAAYFEE